MIKHVLFKNEDIVVDYYTRDIPSDTIVVTGNGLWPRMIEDGIIMDGMGMYGSEIYKSGYDVLAIKNKGYDYYSNLTMQEIEQIIDAFNSITKKKYKRRLYFGGCAASWIALVLSKYLEFTLILLLTPRNELLPTDLDNLGLSFKIDLDKELISPSSHFILGCNFNHKWDYENLLRFANVIDEKNITIINIPDSEDQHDIMYTLKKNKIWKQFFFNILKDGTIMDHAAIIK